MSKPSITDNTEQPAPPSKATSRHWLHYSFIVVMIINFTAYILPRLLTKTASSIPDPGSITTFQLFAMLFVAPIILWATLLPLAIFVDPQVKLSEKFALTNHHLPHLLIALTAGIIFYIICSIINLISQAVMTALHITLPEPLLPQLAAQCSNSNFIMLSFAVIVVAPITEELIFRRIIFSWIKQYLSTWQAIIITSALFAAVHDTMAMFAALFLLAIGFQLLYIRCRSLLPSIVMHACFNSITIILLLLIRLAIIPETGAA